MAVTNSKEQALQILRDQLTTDSNGNHQLLTYYLKVILANQSAQFQLPDKSTVSLSSSELWSEILAWRDSTGISLPMGDRGSRHIRASRLLNYLELNVQGKSREAAANFRSILDTVNQKPLASTRPTAPTDKAFKDALNLRNLQIEALNAKFIGKLSNRLQQTKFLARFQGDPHTLSVLTATLAANANNLRQPKDARDLYIAAEEITRLTTLRSRDGAINNAAHLAFSNSTTDELNEVLDTIDDTVKQVYGKTNSGEQEFQADMTKLASLSHFTTISDIPTLLNLAVANDPDRAKLARAIQSTIIATSSSHFVSGEDILKESLASAGLPDSAFTHLAQLAPLIEEARQNEVGKILGGDIHERDPRLLHTLHLAQDVGVSPEVPWLTRADLDARGAALQKQYNVSATTNLKDSLQTALSQELAKGDKADFNLIVDLRHHLNLTNDYDRFEQEVDGDIMYSLRRRFGKLRGRYAAVRAPIDRFTQKIGAKYWEIDDFIHSPLKYLAEQWAKLEEKVPILNPGKFIYDKAVGAQLWVAQRVLEWSDNLIGRGHWASGLLTHVSDFTKGFVHEGGSWTGANLVFVEKKWGDLLNWGAQKAKFESWQAFKAHVGTKLWDGFSKIAPEMAAKASKGALGELVASLTAGTLSAGTTLAIQIGLMVLSEGIKRVWNVITNKGGARDKLLDRLPLILAGASAFLAAVPGALLAGLLAFGSGAMALLSGAITALLTSIFIPAMIFVGGAIAALYFFTQIYTLTSYTDSSSTPYQELVAGIVCDAGGGGPGSAAVCIADYLQQCQLSPLKSNLLSGEGWKCLLAQTALTQEAKDAIESSTAGNTYFQCVGMAAAYIGQAYGISFPQINAKDYANNAPDGFRWISGGGSCQPGALFVDTGGTYGHIGVVIDCAGANIVCVDANYGGPGVTRNSDSCRYPTSSIAGYLIKI